MLVTFTVYGDTVNFGFIALDDGLYISENDYVKSGLTADSIKWAFVDTSSGMWIPFTWLSLMAGVELHEISPAGHHLTNVILHLINGLLLLYLLNRVTGHFWPSVFVAALFAVHPIHVESVAWVTERKDVLSTMFFLLALWMYCRYTQRPCLAGYIPVLLFYGATLMAKPMFVTFPFLLILLDYWPFGRFLALGNGNHHTAWNRSWPGGLLLEKVPFLILSLVISIVTYRALQGTGGMQFVTSTFDARLTNSLSAYVLYIWKLIYPVNLVVLYPFANTVSWSKIFGAAALLIIITGGCIRYARSSPYLLVGWFWYLGMLVPVIGLIDAGPQAMADRFVYVPFIGLYIAVAWGIRKIVSGYGRGKKVVFTAAIFLILSLMGASWHQLRYWENSEKLFNHTLAHTTGNWMIHFNLGLTLDKQGRTAKAIWHYYEALRFKPDFIQACNNLGKAYEKQGRVQEAIAQYKIALQINPRYVAAHHNLGNVHADQGRDNEAIQHYLAAVKIQPDFAYALNSLGVVYGRQGDIARAMKYYRTAIKADPGFDDAYYNLGVALSLQGRPDAAIEKYLAAVRINPDHARAHGNLGVAYARKGQATAAVAHFKEAVRIDPDDRQARGNLVAMQSALRPRP